MAEEPPDLIITDFKMPDLDGAEFIRQFKVQDTAADVPVIVITAYETQMLKGMAYELRYDPAMARRVAVVGSLMLYISFINLFLAILRIIGDRR